MNIQLMQHTGLLVNQYAANVQVWIEQEAVLTDWNELQFG